MAVNFDTSICSGKRWMVGLRVSDCTSIDWFHEWPEEALMSVSKKFLNEETFVPASIKKSVGQFMSF